ncbi:MAG: DUF4159 domain-containing protein [Gemmatimonadales bacterium]
MKPRIAVLALVVLGAALSILEAQRGERSRGEQEVLDNVPYDGRWTFVRVRFATAFTGFGDFRGSRGEPPWGHDYPRAERHFTKILGELTTVGPRQDASNVIALDDPELFKYPIAYICEPGFWGPTDAEVAGLRAYLQKGGFLIVDDFRGADFLNFEAQMRKVLPDARLTVLTAAHPIFDSFYRIESLETIVPPYGGLQPVFYGIFEDNDPAKRLLVIVNHNNDIAEYWEYSDEGYFPIELSNEAYKLGVNYLIYALSR